MMDGVGFDITTILKFQPPSLICPACRGLFSYPKFEHNVTCSCPVCAVEYVQEDADRWGSSKHLLMDHFREQGWVIDHGDLFGHATALAEVIRDSHGGRTGLSKPWPVTRTFFEVLSRARYFVHFATWGISHRQIGALKLASMRVPVYGFASEVWDSTRVELTEFPDEAPNMTAKVIESRRGAWDRPHQKLFIVDGLVAFKGSANLTNTGLRNADRGLDISEVVTDFAEVTELNNKYFAPVWRATTAPEDTFAWSALPF